MSVMPEYAAVERMRLPVTRMPHKKHLVFNIDGLLFEIPEACQSVSCCLAFALVAV